jgi:hypothetical protein
LVWWLQRLLAKKCTRIWCNYHRYKKLTILSRMRQISSNVIIFSRNFCYPCFSLQFLFDYGPVIPTFHYQRLCPKNVHWPVNEFI